MIIICHLCKHGGPLEYCQSPHAVTLPDEKRKCWHTSCAFFEAVPRDEALDNELRDKMRRRNEPGLFDA